MSLMVLVYVSFAKNRAMSTDELKDILVTARDKNQAVGLTGMLLYRNGFFIQALEGEEEQVSKTFDVIKQDPRHTNILVMYKNKIKERSFGDWSMGFKVLDDDALATVDGFNNMAFDVNSFSKNPSHAKILLENFSRVG